MHPTRGCAFFAILLQSWEISEKWHLCWPWLGQMPYIHISIYIYRSIYRSIYIYIYIYMLLCSISGCPFLSLRVQNCSPFRLLMQPFWNPKNRVFPWWNYVVRHKFCLEMMTCRLSSNAFKNGRLMLRNIGSPLSNAYRHPMFERIYFPCFKPFLAQASKPRNPYFFCSVFEAKQLFYQNPPNMCSRIFPSQKNEKMKNLNSHGSLLF